MILKDHKVYVYMWDNDPIQQEYRIGTYIVKGYVIPDCLCEDIIEASRKENIYFPYSNVIDAFVNCLLYGNGQVVSTDFSRFLQMELLDNID